MRRLNLLFLGILLTVIVVLGGGMHLVHGIQVRRNASALLDRARSAEADKDLEKAEQSLSQYLNFRHEDGTAWKEYARVCGSARTPIRRRREQVFLVHEEAFRYNPDDSTLERRCADLALEQGRYNDAQRHLTNLLEEGPQRVQGSTGGGRAGGSAGPMRTRVTQYADAEKWFEQAIEHDPRRVACYDRLARLRRADLRRTRGRRRHDHAMVAQNPKAGLAYIYRWRYSDEFSPPADASDLQKALKLAPDDLEVLLTAAIASEQKRDVAAARTYFEKGFKLDPQEPRLRPGPGSPGDPGTDTSIEPRPSCGRAFQANPSIELAFVLAETLILQGKIEGKDEAAGYIALLQNAGLGDTLVRFLEAEILFQQKKWTEAIARDRDGPGGPGSRSPAHRPARSHAGRMLWPRR